MSENRCLVCDEPEWGTLCATCATQGWTDKMVLQAIVDALCTTRR